MDVQIQLDKTEATYTNRDTVSGRLILHTKSSVDVSAIQVTLSGSALSRLDSGKRTELHQLFQKTQQVFPPLGDLGMASYFTLGHGTYAFSFSIPFPQVSECYRTSMEGNRSRGSCGNLPKKKHQTIHVLRRLPPSTTGGRATAAEITYSLEASIRTSERIRSSEITVSRGITFYPVTDFNPPSHNLIERRSVILNPDLEKPIPTSYQIEVQLSDGACLLLGEPIPLTIYITRITGPSCDLILNDFQSMLIETTEVRVHGSVETNSQLYVLQTVSNLRKRVYADGTSAGSTVSLDVSLWRHHRLPYSLTPTFETCNISRGYKLQIRLGFWFGLGNVLTRVLEVEFPVYIVAPCPAKNPPRA